MLRRIVLGSGSAAHQWLRAASLRVPMAHALGGPKKLARARCENASSKQAEDDE